MTKSQTDTQPESTPGAGGEVQWPTSPTVDRFVVLGRLGAGGMGVVLSAYDPMLDRRVALKLVRPGAGTDSDSERRALLQREAQAMARLSHPNVVAVHDVGAVGEQLFIAMEFVDGPTLRSWIDDGHDWREVIRLFGAIGSGLAAAHAAGLVHRDFKPENVLIGRDGRPRVLDFGLVGNVGDPGGPRPGTVVGTKGYMSPEQLRGVPTDARGDQFSFCVALYEALDGAPPFAKDNYREAVSRGDAPGLPRRAPKWLGEIVVRGLSQRSEDRWADMSALLAALARDPTKLRRRVVLACAGAVAVAGVLLAARHAGRTGGARPPLCTGDDLHDVWDGSRRDAVAGAFTATGLPYASATLARVDASLDHYANAWTTMHDEVCHMASHADPQADSLRDLRMACLQARRSTLAALTDEWTHGIDADGLEGAVSAAASLPPLDLCADTRALLGRAPLPHDPVMLARVDATRAALDHVRALRAAGRMQAARTEAEAARQRALDDGYAPASAEAALMYGRVLHAFGEPAAVAPLQEATTLAEHAGDDALAADAAIEVLGAMVDTGQTRMAIATAPLAEALVVRAGDRLVQRGALRMWQGSALIKSARTPEGVQMLAEARSLFTQALGANDPITLEAGVRLYKGLAEAGEAGRRDALGKELLASALEVLGPDHPQTALLMGRIGQAAADESEFDTAHRMVDRALDITERTYGPDALPTAVMVNYAGVVAEQENHTDVAAQAYERVFAIRRKLLAPDHPLVAHALANLAIAHDWQGRHTQALDELATAIAVMRQNYGEDNNDVAYETGTRGWLLANAGRYQEARDSLQEAIAIWKRIDAPDQINTAFTTLSLVKLDTVVGRYGEARELLEPATKILSKAYGQDHRSIAFATSLRARCDLDEHGTTDLAPLEVAVRNVDKPHVPPADRGAVRLELARARWAAGDRAGAKQQLALTERDLVQAGPMGAVDLQRLHSWLAAHDVR